MTTILTQSQMTALTAQAAKAATYPSTDANGSLLADWYINDSGNAVYAGPEIATRGVGIYGQTPENLVLVGLLKSAALNLIVQPSMTLTVLNTPAVWTGTYNITSLTDYLNAPEIQNLSEIALYEGAFQGLVDSNIITGDEAPRYIATFLQPAVRYGVDAVVAWVKGELSSDDASAVLIRARQGQYAIDFVNTYGNVLNVAPAAEVSINTVIRDQVDQAVTDVIGNPKIPNIEYVTIANVSANISANANVSISILPTANDDGTFRFAPGSRRG
jgi:hypothetical protein